MDLDYNDQVKNLDELHLNKFITSLKFVLIDNNNMIRGYYSYDDAEQIALLKENLSFLSEEI